MDRDSATRLFSDYLEGTLPREQREALEDYLQGDQEAAAELEALRRTLSSLSALRPEMPSARFTRKVEHRIRIRSRGRFFSDRLLTRLPFEWFSFVIIMLLLTLYMLLVLDLRGTHPEAPPSGQTSTSSEAGERSPSKRRTGNAE
jgi:anti-sigma-K factor RskA